MSGIIRQIGEPADPVQWRDLESDGKWRGARHVRHETSVLADEQ
jgi:hypothetical protein